MSRIERVLAIETSCDDTSAAVVRADGYVESVLSAHQNAAHEAFGGIVPEIASRNHSLHLMPLIDECLRRAGIKLTDVQGIAVTAMPGLIGSLLVGLTTAKSLSLASDIPFIAINHLEGHLLAPFLRDDDFSPPNGFTYPFVALAVSGGHTSLYLVRGLGEYDVLGQTIDDAAGEAYDKFGKMLGLGFPGGVRVDRFARSGNQTRFQFPRPMTKEEHLNFSFSGMKTSAARILNALSLQDRAELDRDVREEVTAGILSDLCASFQEAVSDVLLDRLARAVKLTGIQRAVLTGGVSANSRLRERAAEWAVTERVELVVPPLRYCTDNAAMIGFAGIQRLNRGERSAQTVGPLARAPLGVAPLPDNLPPWLKKAWS